MTEKEILDIFRKTNALLEGHFVLTSGLHSPQYIEKFRILENPKYTETLCKELAGEFKNKNVTVVAGPMTGGIILAYEVGKQLDTRAIFTERIDGKMTLRRGFTISPSDNVVIVEDIITTGGSVNEVIEVVNRAGAKIIGIGCLADRSSPKDSFRSGTAKFEHPFKPLVTIEAVAYKPEDCPLCKSGIPAMKPGSMNK